MATAFVLAAAGCSSAAPKAQAMPAQSAATAPAATSAATTAPTPVVVVTTKAAAVVPAQPLVTDLPQFDLAGSGTGCDMHYSQNSSGMTITRFTLAGPGELITHVTGPAPDYVIHRNDNQVQAGNVAYSYDVPLSEVQDMGAVMAFSDGSSASCSIGPGATAP
ncbi:MAG TPA: hypothetical protein VGX23_33705 [Actinocrinis sp.]|nr:hypothetical protein [Actinocrinis sp.]